MCDTTGALPGVVMTAVRGQRRRAGSFRLYP